MRCAIVNFGTEMIGNPFWMTDANNFSNPSKFNRSVRLIEDELNHNARHQFGMERHCFMPDVDG